MKHLNFCKVKRFFLVFLFFLTFGTSKIFSQSTSPLVYGIEAYGVSNSIITISWNLPLKTENSYINSLMIFRDSRPITSYSQILDLQPIATLPHGAVSYNDKVEDYRDYYYAVISITKEGNFDKEELYYDEELDAPQVLGDGTVYALVLPGVNATVNGAKIKSKTKVQINIPEQKSQETKKTYEGDTLREQPLPFIDVLGDEIKPESKISEKAKIKALSLTKNSKLKKNILEPYIFEEDLISPIGGDEYILFEILRTSFIKQNYTKSIQDLNNFLAQNRSEKVSQRAHFYLGESYYYTGNYEMALTKFLELQDVYPSVSRKWSESTLDLWQPK